MRHQAHTEERRRVVYGGGITGGARARTLSAFLLRVAEVCRLFSSVESSRFFSPGEGEGLGLGRG